MKTYTSEEAYKATLEYFGGDEEAARVWVEKFAKQDAEGEIIDRTPDDMRHRVAQTIAAKEAASNGKLSADDIYAILERSNYYAPSNDVRTQVVENRPQELECDVVRFQNQKDKWIAFVGLKDGRPYEIFTGLADDEMGIALPKSVTKGKIIKVVQEDGQKRYDFQFVNTRGFKTTVEGLSYKFDREFWNYAKLISGVLRYGMPIDQVVHMISGLQMDNDSINSWTTGVARVLKRYIPGAVEEEAEN